MMGKAVLEATALGNAVLRWLFR